MTAVYGKVNMHTWWQHVGELCLCTVHFMGRGVWLHCVFSFFYHYISKHVSWTDLNNDIHIQRTVKIEGSRYGSNYMCRAMYAQSHNIWKYMAQFIFIVGMNWQLIWIISTLAKCENITYGLTHCTPGAQKNHIIYLVRGIFTMIIPE